jgi:hypothetical protein
MEYETVTDPEIIQRVKDFAALVVSDLGPLEDPALMMSAMAMATGGMITHYSSDPEASAEFHHVRVKETIKSMKKATH